MRRYLAIIAVLAFAGRLQAQPSDTTSTPERRQLRASSTAGANIQIDGVLDEMVWESTEVSGGFTERTPEPGAPAPVTTEVRVLYDSDALYVGVQMSLAPGEVPRGSERVRDSFGIFSDDAVTLKFDVRTDRRTTLGFGVNALGTQIDYIALDNGQEFRREHDAIWQAETSITHTHWIAEFRIPAPALGLPEREGARVIGFNVTRDHNARLATYDWSELPPEYGAMSAQHYGELLGVQGIGDGAPLALMPFLLFGAPHDGTLPVELKAGGELRLRLGPDIWSEVTVFTDFAAVDLDEPTANLSRFPLFLPEQRPFFLSGVSIFKFGIPSQAQLFFSRRIGLDEDGETVPIFGGAKVFGRTGAPRFRRSDRAHRLCRGGTGCSLVGGPHSSDHRRGLTRRRDARTARQRSDQHRRRN